MRRIIEVAVELCRGMVPLVIAASMVTTVAAASTITGDDRVPADGKVPPIVYVRTKPFVVQAHYYREKIVRCPLGTRIISAGFMTDGNTFLDGFKQQGRRGWYISLYNTNKWEGWARVSAVCLPLHG